MEIVVEGKSKKYVTPDQVIFNFNFITKSTDYDEVIDKGTLNVKEFIERILLTNNIKETDLKTNHFDVRKETKYNELTRTYDFDCYSYNQNANLKLDYNLELMSVLIKAISKLDNPPLYTINFGVKNCEKYNAILLKECYKDAEKKAKAIASASGKVLKDCLKTDFKPLYNVYSSSSQLNNDFGRYKSAIHGETSSVSFFTNFTPSDIELNETLYCLWITE